MTLERDKWFNKNQPSFYSDESGILYHSFGGHIASPHDRTEENVSSPLRAMAQQCLIDRGKSIPTPYPKTVEDFPKDGPCSLEFMMKYRNYGARISYEAKFDQEHVAVIGFVLLARPQEYGKNGVRSYFVDETGIVRATAEDRAGGPDDQPIPGCEYDYNPCLNP